MKKKFLLLVFMIILPAIILFSGCCTEKDIEIRVAGEYIQWSYVGENTWKDVIDINSIKSSLGEIYKGEKGDVGPQGEHGINGKEVEFRVNDDYIQWHYIGDNEWKNLISIDSLKTDSQGVENIQELDFYPLDDGTYGVGCGKSIELSIVKIPEKHKGKTVSKIIDNGFNYANAKYTEIKLPNSIKSIGKNAFLNLDNLTQIIIPKSVEDINDNVFGGCNNLIIYCLAESIPSKWSLNWNSNRPVCLYRDEKPTTYGNYWHYVEGVATPWKEINKEELKTKLFIGDCFIDLSVNMFQNSQNVCSSRFNRGSEGNSILDNSIHLGYRDFFIDENDPTKNITSYTIVYTIFNLQYLTLHVDFTNILYNADKYFTTTIECSNDGNQLFSIDDFGKDVDSNKYYSINNNGNIDLKSLSLDARKTLTISIKYVLNTHTQPFPFVFGGESNLRMSL